ncbi:MAG: transcriptional regulator with XRE-family HTH domain [Alcanivorax sp.]|jgi:transcriptional regulator with XRE-family HTH domain
MTELTELAKNFTAARKANFPNDSLADFSVRIGVSRATLQKMDSGDLRVGLHSYYRAAQILGLAASFDGLFKREASLFDD